MTDKEKKELLIALCGYYPYGLMVEIEGYGISKLNGIDNGTVSTDMGINYPLWLVKPYLRPMSSMTDEEVNEFEQITDDIFDNGTPEEIWSTVIDWLNAHHFDFRNLIERGLAIDCSKLNIY